MLNTGSQLLKDMQISKASKVRRLRLEVKAVGVRLERSGVGTCLEGNLRLDSASDSDTSGRRPCRHPSTGSTLSGVCKSARVFLDSFKPRCPLFPLCPCVMCVFSIRPSCPPVLVDPAEKNSRNKNKSLRKYRASTTAPWNRTCSSAFSHHSRPFSSSCHHHPPPRPYLRPFTLFTFSPAPDAADTANPPTTI